ncbi:MAG: hypothetical protein J6B98_03805 [Bacilli bacterium]|nr:hypothetical protein [Bacilli bacterium]
MKNLKKFLMGLFCVIAAVLLVGCEDVELSNSKEFNEKGFSITLTEDFVKKDIVSATYYYESMNSIAMALKEEFSNLEVVGLTEDSSIEDYTKVVLANNKMSEDNLKYSDDNKYIYFEYEKEVSGSNMYYLAVVKKGSDAFWLMNFACKADQKADLQDNFHEYASSIKVD